MEQDSGPNTSGSSAASTPSPSPTYQSNPLEVDRFIKSAELVEYKKRQHTREEPINVAPSKIQVAPSPAPEEMQNLLKENREPERAGPKLCHWMRRCWSMLNNSAVYLLFIVIVVFGIVLAYSQRNSPAAEQFLKLDPCPTEEWVYYRKYCYYHNLNRTDWNTSQNFCAEHGATLAVIHKEEDLDSITKICTIDCWIGLRKTEEGFQWVDGTPYNSSLFQVHGQEDCTYVKSNTVYTTDCNLPRPSICKMKPYQAAKGPEDPR